MTPDILHILKNEEILEIDQDPVVGQSISPFRWGYNVSFSLSAFFVAPEPIISRRLGTPCSILEWSISKVEPCLCSYVTHKSEYKSLDPCRSPIFRQVNCFRSFSRGVWINYDRTCGAHGQWYSGPKPPHMVYLCTELSRSFSKMQVMSLHMPCAVAFQCTDQNGTSAA